MSILKRSPKPDASKVYVAVTSFAWAGEGGPSSVRRSERFRGDAPIVKATFGDLWIEDGATSDEMAAARARLTHPSTWYPQPEPVEVPEPVVQMVCTKAVVLTASLVAGGAPSFLQVAPGDVLPSNHAAVRKYPKHFEPVAES